MSEELIHTYESTLGFSQCMSSRLVGKIHNCASSGRVNKHQFKDMMKKAGLYIDSFEDDTAPVSQFFTSFGDGKRMEAKKLAMLGVLLGKGTMETKATLLFDLYRAEKAIDLQAVGKMVTDMCSIALSLLPLYASLELSTAGDAVSLHKLHSYRLKLEVASPFVVAKIKDNLEFGRKRLTFEELNRSKMMKFFYSSQELRHFAMELYPRIPPEMKHRRATSLLSTHCQPADDPRLDVLHYTQQRASTLSHYPSPSLTSLTYGYNRPAGFS